MKKEDLYGFVPAVVTPFNEAGDIMEDAYQDLVKWLIGQGATTICVSGDNGESWALSAAEKGRLTAVQHQPLKIALISRWRLKKMVLRQCYQCHKHMF